MKPSEQLAAAFFDAYERLAPAYGVESTRRAWHELDELRRRHLTLTLETLLEAGYIRLGGIRHPVPTGGRPPKLT